MEEGEFVGTETQWRFDVVGDLENWYRWVLLHTGQEQAISVTYDSDAQALRAAEIAQKDICRAPIKVHS
jgi:hypothetical protein